MACLIEMHWEIRVSLIPSQGITTDGLLSRHRFWITLRFESFTLGPMLTLTWP